MEPHDEIKNNNGRSNLLKRDLKDLMKVGNDQRRSTLENKLYFLECLQQTKGVVTAVCMRTSISRATYYHWMKTDKIFRESVEEIKHEKAEILEDRLFSLAHEGDIKALKYLHSFYARRTSTHQDTSVHIYHHTDKNPEEPKRFSITNVVDDLLTRINEQEAKAKDESRQ